MNKYNVEKMSRKELIEFIEDAKQGRVESKKTNNWLFWNGKIFLNDSEKEVKREYFEKNYKGLTINGDPKDCIIIIKEDDRSKYPHVKDSRFIQVQSINTAINIFKLNK